MAYRLRIYKLLSPLGKTLGGFELKLRQLNDTVTLDCGVGLRLGCILSETEIYHM